MSEGEERFRLAIFTALMEARFLYESERDPTKEDYDKLVEILMKSLEVEDERREKD